MNGLLHQGKYRPARHSVAGYSILFAWSEASSSSMVMKTLIVDDEPIARKVLREELELVPDVAVLCEADNGADALRKVAEYRPDIVFLDLQMPIMGGFDVIRQLRRGTQMPVIIIVTAFNEFALQAFEVGAIDYLLKPIRQERLAEAVARARRLTGPEAVERMALLQEVADRQDGIQTTRIVGKLGEEYYLLSADEVYALQADKDLVWLITAKGRYLGTHTLKVLEQRLGNASFRRIHRNALVNVNYVRKMSPLSSQRWLITLSNDQEFVGSKRQAQSIRRLLRA
jgi:two-component system, LytTR family, response regulator